MVSEEADKRAKLDAGSPGCPFPSLLVCHISTPARFASLPPTCVLSLHCLVFASEPGSYTTAQRRAIPQCESVYTRYLQLVVLISDLAARGTVSGDTEAAESFASLATRQSAPTLQERALAQRPTRVRSHSNRAAPPATCTFFAAKVELHLTTPAAAVTTAHACRFLVSQLPGLLIIQRRSLHSLNTPSTRVAL